MYKHKIKPVLSYLQLCKWPELGSEWIFDNASRKQCKKKANFSGLLSNYVRFFFVLHWITYDGRKQRRKYCVLFQITGNGHVNKKNRIMNTLKLGR